MAGEILTADTADLSEEHLAYYFYHAPQTAYGDVKQDATVPLTDYLIAGGNHVFTTFALANGVGLARERTVADTDWERIEENHTEYKADVRLRNAYWLKPDTDRERLKSSILKHGSAAVSMYYSVAYLNENAYYDPDVTAVNHAVTLIGWDDDYDRANFRQQPAANGAWLAKNSYGTEFADGGYFWISYEDASLCSKTAKAFVYEFEDAAKYAYTYAHDGSSGVCMDEAAGDTGYRVASGGSVANVFTVPKDIPTEYQQIEAVSFALFDTDVSYQIQIYRAAAYTAEGRTGEPVLTEPVCGQTESVGFYTVPLTQPVQLAAGESFAVELTLSKADGTDISYFADKTYQNEDWIAFVNQTAPGESYAMINGVWSDLSESGATARIRAYANPVQTAGTDNTPQEEQKEPERLEWVVEKQKEQEQKKPQATPEEVPQESETVQEQMAGQQKLVSEGQTAMAKAGEPPRTADEAELGVWLAAALMSLLGLAAGVKKYG